jgi:prepilin-type N-terminal cleavage/methylation domain-containing protein/prepilin-type processing-associated H-X9-DG protein
MPVRRLTGFSLVELLVVLAVVAVLAAVLFPVYARARASGRKATCVAQLAQIAKALRMYADDYDRTIVPARTAVTTSGSRGMTWCVLLQPYIGSTRVLICPSDMNPRPTAQSVCYPHSYGINYLLSYNTAWGVASMVTSISQVQRVSDIIAFFEIRGDVEAMGSGFYDHRLARLEPRHDGFGNFAFLDGHIKGLRVEAVNDRRVWDPFVP